MPGVVLAVVHRPDMAESVLAAAARLAELTGAARINVLAIRTPPLATIMPTEEILTREQEARIRAAEERRTGKLKEIYSAWAGVGVAAAEQRRITTEWFDVEGSPEQAVTEWGRRADFVVLKRPRPHDPEPEREALHAALFGTGRPILLVPPGGSSGAFGRRVAIAWRDDERTTRAVLAALRWLGDSAEHVDVLAGGRDGTPPPHLPDILDEHGIGTAELHVLPITGQRAFGEVLLAKAHELGSDMLVMGAFVHHPARSLILGGVTRHILAFADIPVFMRH